MVVMKMKNNLVSRFYKNFDTDFPKTNFNMFKFSDFIKTIMMWVGLAIVFQLVGSLFYINDVANINVGLIGGISMILSEVFTIMWLARKVRKANDVRFKDVISKWISNFFKPFAHVKTWVLVISFIFIVVFINGSTGNILRAIEMSMNNMIVDKNAAQLREMMGQSSTLVLAFVSVFAPIFEEILFRGLFQSVMFNWLTSKFKFTEKQIYYISIFIVSFAFAFAHNMSFNPFLLAQYFVVGLYLQHLSHKYNSILPSIYAHMGMNSVASIVMLALVAQ